MKLGFCALGLLLSVAAGVRADEIRLKDGSKIVGMIVDFETDSFKVQTAYGYAMIRKDSIAQIIPTEPVQSKESVESPAKKAPAELATVAGKNSTRVKVDVRPASSVSAAPNATPAVLSPPASAKSGIAAAALPMPQPNPRPAPAVPMTAVAAAPALAPELPAPPVAPAPIRELVQGNLYTNETYKFQLYRPPGWDVTPEARKALPNAVMAMGTGDGTTLFIVGRETAHDSFQEQAANSERALRKIYENYRPISSTQRSVDGSPAVEWRFRGVADGHDWSVTALTVARGDAVLTLLGMTYADSDLIQIRENVIAKMIGSLRFTTPQ